MSDNHPVKRRRLHAVTRAIRRALTLSVIVLLVGVVLTGAGVVVWGHFWDFRVNNPYSGGGGTLSAGLVFAYLAATHLIHTENTALAGV